MLLIVGLGNPGEKFKKTRHNIGRELLTEWQKKNNLKDFEADKKLAALVSKNKKIILLLPETMMNKSGNSVKSAIRIFKAKPKNIIAIHDDADILIGRAKLSFGKHSAGHKGVESVKRALGTWDFWRLRIGIQKKKRVDAMKLVLQKFTPAEEKVLKNIKKKLFKGLALLAADEKNQAVNIINST